MLKKDAATSWTEECQKAFDKIKEYLFKPPILVPLEPGRPLLLYLSILDGAFGCVLGQHDETGRKEHAIYYLKGGQRATIGRSFGRNPVDGEYEPLKTYFPDEEVSFAGEDITEAYDGWRMFFDGAANFKGVGIGAVLVSETSQHYPVSAKLKFSCTNNMAEYEACILGLRLAIDMNVQELLVIGDSDLLVHQILGEWATKNTKILPYLHCVQELIKRNFIDPIPIGIHKQPAYCSHVEEESDGNAWFHDIREYSAKGEYPEHATHTQKRTLRRPQMTGVVEAANKNIEKILMKMVDNYKQWHKMLPFAMLGYRTTVRTSTGATPYLLVYSTEVVIPAEEEIPSLRIIQEAELNDAEWVQSRYERLALIDGKRMNVPYVAQGNSNRIPRQEQRPRKKKKGQTDLSPTKLMIFLWMQA
ncbi:uncharacterized protein [Nicotiana tomentosiformis]|uniref:uncharacterized protein n=1 Tax=Nicotiana tomentosiformis TaxID=4098 RepID=UPI00388C9A2B